MTNSPLTPEERLAKLEGVYNHLSTKTDIAELKTDMAKLKAELSKEFTNQIKEVRKGLNQLQGGIAVLGVVVILLQLWTKLASG